HVHAYGPWRATPALDFLHRLLDVSRVRADHGLQPARILAAEVVEPAMLRPHELDIDLAVLVPAWPAGIDEELHVDAFLVHVGNTRLYVQVIGMSPWMLAPHEVAGYTGRVRSRLRLTQHARHIRAPS